MQTYPIPFNEAARQAAVDRIAGPVRGGDPVLDHIVASVQELLDVPSAFISIVDGTRQWFPARINLSETEMPRNGAICAHTIVQTGPLIIPDAHADERFAQHPAVTGTPHVRFYVGAPIVLSDGLRVGSLCAIDLVPRDPPPQRTLKVLEHLARACASALERRAPAPAASGPRRQPALDQAQNELLVLLSHELRTPLTSILGFTRLLEPRVSGREARMVGAVGAAAQHLSELVEHLLKFVDLATGEVRLAEAPIAVDDILREAQTVVQPLFAEARKTLDVTTAGPGAVRADAAHLQAALMCLLMNALTHGGRAVRLTGEMRASGETVLSVEDDGGGLAAPAAQCLEPFRIGADPDTRCGSGLGLGLPLTKRLVELHGGSLNLTSAPEGVRAEIVLPAWRRVAAGRPADAGQAGPTRAPGVA